MDITEDTIPELQPIYSFLNSHSNKLYQEGYFLKLDDQNTRMLDPDPIAVFTIPTYLPLTPRGLHIHHFTHVLQGCPANDVVNRG